jgi:hypothetical protein
MTWLSKALALALLLAGCASQQEVSLLPRGDAKPATGTLDRLRNEMVVNLDGKAYRGTMQMQTASSSTWTPLGMRTTNTTANQASALLLGDGGGQIRCDFGWDAMMTSATGVCTDNKNQAYDLMIRQ